MKVTVVGAGAVGGYFGGRLAEAGVDVTFLVRERRGDELRARGLRISSPHGDYQFEPKLARSAQDIPACDVLVLAVKNYHLEAALEPLRPLIERGAKVLPLLNGIGHLETLKRTFGEAAVLGGFCNIIVTLNEHGDVVHTSKNHDYSFGALQESQVALCEQLQACAAPAKLNVNNMPNVYQAMWQKYMFITAFSGVTTASRLSIDHVIQNEATRDVFERTLQEMHQLANQYGADLPASLIPQIIAGMEKLPAGSTSSMHQDFRKGYTLEVESLQGTAVQMAAKQGLTLPSVQTLYGLIKPYEQPSVNRDAR